MKPYVTLICCLGIVGLAANGSHSDEPTGQTRPGISSQVEVRLTDGSNVVMSLLQESFEITTEYGKLSVPRADVRQIEFGIRTTDEDRQKIDAAIGRLSSKIYEE